MSAFQEFPPPDLLYALVELYFRRMNDHNPLLHEPTFRKSVDRGLHLHHGDFGATVLLVCANGARFSNDPRVQLDDQGQQSAGWKWFKQVEEARRLQFAPAKLYDLQSYAVRVMTMRFLWCSSRHTAHDPLSPRLCGLCCVLDANRHGHPSGSRCRGPSKTHVQCDTNCGRGTVEARILVRDALSQTQSCHMRSYQSERAGY